MNLWGGQSLKEKLVDRTSLFFIGFILFYGVQGVVSFFHDGSAPPLDIFATTLVISVFFVLHLLVRFKGVVPLFLGIGFFPHIIGLYKIIPYNEYYIGTLYGWSGLWYQYDFFVHAFAIFCFSIVVCSVFYPYLLRGLKSKFLVFFILLFFMIGIGGFNEVLEYVGYDVIGYGEGFLEYGDGDSTPDSGPWQDASTDLLANILGGLVGIGGFILLKKEDLT